MAAPFKPLKVYKSSAGSGKTTILALEYLKLALGKGEHFRHILALTFTNKAAQEMKDRILDYLQLIIDYGKDQKNKKPFFLDSLISDIPNYQNIQSDKALQKISNDANYLYKNLIHRYSEYAVTTIDSFTNRIIKSFSHDLGLSFNYQVELKTALLIDLAIEELLSRIDKEEGLLTKVLANYSQSKIDSEKSRNIRQDLKSRAYSLLNDLEEEYLVSLRDMSLEDLQNIQFEIEKSVSSFENYIQKIANDFIEICNSRGIEKASFFGRAAFYNYFDRISSGDFSKLIPNATSLKVIDENKWTAGKVSFDQKELIETHKTRFIQLFNEISVAIDSFSDYKLRKEINNHFYPFMILLELEKILNQMKSEQQMIHISDFNKVISKNVAHETAPYIYERIGNKFQNYLLDEFQDTSVLQWHNLIPLVENGISQNYFSLVVGDAKQSIYRWRGSDVKQFSEFPRLTKDTDDPYMIQRQNLLNQSFKEVNLVTNYRTGKNIVEFNNLLFEFIKTQNYLPESMLKIYESSDQLIHNNETESFVQIHTIDSKNAENSEEANQEYIQKVFELVQQCKNDGYRLKDIAVLARKNKLLIEIARYLLEKGISVISTESLHADSSPLVKFILSFINHLYFPKESLYQSEIIYFLSQSEKYKNQVQFKEIIEKNKSTDALKPFWKLIDINFDSEELINSDTYEAIESICEIFDLDRTDSLLHFFLEAAYIFSQEKHQDLSHFLEWWNINAEDYKLDVPEDWEAVKLLSFHKAKGLEFPVVINLFGESHFKESNFHSPEIWLHPQLEDIPQLKSFPFKINSLEDTKFNEIYQVEKDYEVLDKINLFYVAMTRPKERLYLLTDVFHPSKSESFKFSKLTAEFITEHHFQKIQEHCFQYGETNQISVVDEKVELNPSLNKLNHTSWNKHITMSLDTDDEKLAAADWGTKAHRFFAQIKSEEDLYIQSTQFKNKLHLTEEELSELVKKAEQVYKHPVISRLYKNEHMILNERDFYTRDQKVLRPDRIIKTKDELFILDYKTGHKKPADEKQIKEYCQELTKLTGLKSSGFLVYLQNKIDVIEIK